MIAVFVMIVTVENWVTVEIFQDFCLQNSELERRSKKVDIPHQNTY